MMRLEVARLTVSWLLENLISTGPPLPLFRYYLLFWVSDYSSNWSAWPILRTLTLQWKLKPNVYPQETNHLKTRLLSFWCTVLFREEQCGREHHLVAGSCTCCCGEKIREDASCPWLANKWGLMFFPAHNFYQENEVGSRCGVSCICSFPTSVGVCAGACNLHKHFLFKVDLVIQIKRSF